MKHVNSAFFAFVFAFIPSAVLGQQLGLNNSVAINITTTGPLTTQIVAFAGVTSIYVTSFNVIAGNIGTITFEYGTGTNCGVGTTALTGAYPFVANGGVSVGSGVGAVLKAPSGTSLCIVTTAPMAGSVSYLQF